MCRRSGKASSLPAAGRADDRSGMKRGGRESIKSLPVRFRAVWQTPRERVSCGTRLRSGERKRDEERNTQHDVDSRCETLRLCRGSAGSSAAAGNYARKAGSWRLASFPTESSRGWRRTHQSDKPPSWSGFTGVESIRLRVLSMWDGSAFGRGGVVLVSFDYGLGGLGYFAHPA
jgi:hypothetical protein